MENILRFCPCSQVYRHLYFQSFFVRVHCCGSRKCVLSDLRNEGSGINYFEIGQYIGDWKFSIACFRKDGGDLTRIVHVLLIGFSTIGVGNVFWQAPEMMVNLEDSESEDEEDEETGKKEQAEGKNPNNREEDKIKHKANDKVDIWSLGILSK